MATPQTGRNATNAACVVNTQNPGLLRGPGVHFVVARTRFELVISALRGRRPKPLDERAICSKCNGWDGGSRTPIDGTRIRCPAIRRHPNDCIAALGCAFAQERNIREVLRRRKPHF